MPKPFLVNDDAKLESDLIETLLAGLHEWRSDLAYPESHSDMQGAVRGLMKMYEIKRLPLPKPLRLRCGICKGAGKFVQYDGNHSYKEQTCKACDGKGYKESLM